MKFVKLLLSNISKSGYALKEETFAKETFPIWQFFSKFNQVYTREIFHLVAFAKVNSRKNFQFLGQESFFPKT